MPSASVLPKRAALSHLGQRPERNFEHFAERRVPLESSNIEQHRATGVGVIRGEHCSVRKAVNQIGVNRPDNGVAILEFVCDAGFVLDEPAQF